MCLHTRACDSLYSFKLTLISCNILFAFFFVNIMCNAKTALGYPKPFEPLHKKPIKC